MATLLIMLLSYVKCCDFRFSFIFLFSLAPFPDSFVISSALFNEEKELILVSICLEMLAYPGKLGGVIHNIFPANSDWFTNNLHYVKQQNWDYLSIFK